MGTLKTAWVLVKAIPEFLTALIEVLANFLIIGLILTVPVLLVLAILK